MPEWAINSNDQLAEIFIFLHSDCENASASSMAAPLAAGRPHQTCFAVVAEPSSVTKFEQ
jgi:hypothetical protein